MSEIRIEGLRELTLAMQQLPDKMQANIIRGALRAGAKALAEDVRENVPTDTGELRDSVRVSVRLQRGVATARVIAGNKETFYAHFVEFGTAAHKIAGPVRIGNAVVGSVDHPGARKQSFMRPALDNPLAALNEAREYIRTRLRVKNGIDVPGPGNTEDE